METSKEVGAFQIIGLLVSKLNPLGSKFRRCVFEAEATWHERILSFIEVEDAK